MSLLLKKDKKDFKRVLLSSSVYLFLKKECEDFKKEKKKKAHPASLLEEKILTEEGSSCFPFPCMRLFFPMRRRDNKLRIQGKGKQLAEPSVHRKTTFYFLEKENIKFGTNLFLVCFSSK